MTTNLGCLHVKTLYKNNGNFKHFCQRIGGIQVINPDYIDAAKTYLMEQAEKLADDETLPAGIVELGKKLVNDFL